MPVFIKPILAAKDIDLQKRQPDRLMKASDNEGVQWQYSRTLHAGLLTVDIGLCEIQTISVEGNEMCVSLSLFSGYQKHH